MNNKKICFIMCTNNDLYANECIKYINNLEIPDGYEIDVITIREAKSMASGYNAGMKSSDAKYKVYLHQDVFIVNKKFIYEILDIFNDKSIGMIGAVGTPKLIDTCIMWYGERVGSLYTSNIFSAGETVLGKIEGKYKEVEAIDGLMMITQYDIEWRDDIFTDWDFYDVSQSQEFIRKGYKVVVGNQDNIWVNHDDGFMNLEKYYVNRLKFIKEYRNFKKKKFAFIICANDDLYVNECVSYINDIIVPDNIEKEVYIIKDADGMAVAYNEALQKCNADYKAYLHQDMFIINKNFISDCINVFDSNDKIGMLGIIGASSIDKTARFADKWDTGKTFACDLSNEFLLDFSQDKNDKYKCVEAVDGMLMVTSKDVKWRDDLFDKWDFYDISQCMEFKRKGYLVVVPNMENVWTLHDAGVCSENNYDKYREIFCREYREFGFTFSKNDNLISNNFDKCLIEIKNIVLNIIDSKMYNQLDSIFSVSKEKGIMDSELVLLMNAYEIYKMEINNYGKSDVFSDYSIEAIERWYADIKLMLYRIEYDRHNYDANKLIELCRSNDISREKIFCIIQHNIYNKQKVWDYIQNN